MLSTLSQSESRYERKFTIDSLSLNEVLNLLKFHNLKPVVAYPPRTINNIYFDTQDHRFLRGNLDGVGDFRCKVRIRWYGSLYGEIKRPRLEIKVRRGLVLYKHTLPLESFTLTRSTQIKTLAPIWGSQEIGQYCGELSKNLRPVLINQYVRHYFTIPQHPYRVTVDSKLLFRRIFPLWHASLEKPHSKSGIILEFKYPLDSELKPDVFSSELPFRLSRSSKYATGMAMLYDYPLTEV